MEPSRRDVILNAALKEFALKGFDKASTNIIAQESGMSKALMFHYVQNKRDLFLFVYDYFTDLIDKEYGNLIDFSEKDIFARLRQSYLLQVGLIKKYPWVFEVNKLSGMTCSQEINRALEERAQRKNATCHTQIFDNIDESKFREGLDIDTCKQFILWSNIGFTNQILEELRNSESSDVDSESVMARIDGYFAELKKILYKE